MPDKCPRNADLLLYALGRQGETTARGVGQHVERCERCRREVDALERAAGDLRSQALRRPMTEPCLDEMALAELVDGAGDPERRAALMTHLAACVVCRGTVASLARFLAQPAARAEVAKVAGSTRRWSRLALPGIGIAGVTAAAVVLFVVSGLWKVDQRLASSQREVTLTVGVAPEAVAPVGRVEAPNRFVWAGVPLADRYQLIVFDAQGTVVWEAQTRDTALALPASIGLRAASPYFWRVRARTGWDRWSESALVEFTFQAPSDSAR